VNKLLPANLEEMPAVVAKADSSPVLVRAGDFATLAGQELTKTSVFPGLTHRALTSLLRAAKPIVANCVPGGRWPFAIT
jgi:hypothetical protein